jgi:hypothetical protein
MDWIKSLFFWNYINIYLQWRKEISTTQLPFGQSQLHDLVCRYKYFKTKFRVHKNTQIGSFKIDNNIYSNLKFKDIKDNNQYKILHDGAKFSHYRDCLI